MFLTTLRHIGTQHKSHNEGRRRWPELEVDRLRFYGIVDSSLQKTVGQIS